MEDAIGTDGILRVAARSDSPAETGVTARGSRARRSEPVDSFAGADGLTCEAAKAREGSALHRNLGWAGRAIARPNPWLTPKD